jgi:hypothetical protein
VTDVRRIVVTYFSGAVADHQRATVEAIARSLAELQGAAFGGEYDRSAHDRQPLYFVPSDTLLAEEACALRIRTRDDLFGGVVPFAFVATKAIAHPLVAMDATRPPGWTDAFPDRVREAVLPGFTAFTVSDAHRAAAQLLADGPVRLKPGHGIGGRGQVVLCGADQVDDALQRIDPASLATHGVGIELDLSESTTARSGPAVFR